MAARIEGAVRGVLIFLKPFMNYRISVEKKKKTNHNIETESSMKWKGKHPSNQPHPNQELEYFQVPKLPPFCALPVGIAYPFSQSDPYLLKNIYFFIWLLWVLVVASELLDAASGI